MIRPSRRASRQFFLLVLSASAVVAGSGLLPQGAGAQAMGGLGHRSAGGAVGSGNAPAPPQEQPRRQGPSNGPVFFGSPTNNTSTLPIPTQNNAPVFSPGRVFQSPPSSVAPGAPPPFSVGPSPTYSGGPAQDGNLGPYGRWRGGRTGENPNGPVFSGNAGAVGSGNAPAPRREQSREFSSPSNFNAPVFSGTSGSPSVRVTTPIGQRSVPQNYYRNDYLYNAPVTVIGGPSLLGGYYYGNYCDTYSSQYCYPSVFSVYVGFPRYIVSPSVIVIGEPYYPAYYTSYQPFYTPSYQVTYNQTNYYVASEERARDIEKGGEQAQQALKKAYPADSYQAAFADIERAWTEGRITPLRKHLRENDVKLSVYFKGKYTYSIASADFAQITRDAFDRLNTVSFRFTRLRRAKNGDLTAYGKHVYRTADDAGARTDETVPFSTDGSKLYDNSDDPAPGQEKTVYVSYTLRRHDGQWYIIGVNSSPTDMVK